MTTFVVQGVFRDPGHIAGPAPFLTGTLEISAGTVQSMDLSVTGFAEHFTEFYFNQPDGNGWLLSGNTPSSIPDYGYEEYLSFSFLPVSGPGLLNFQQAEIFNGVVVDISYTPNQITTYHGLGLSGTICPLEGCAPFPIIPMPSVPGPILGSGFPALVAIILMLLTRSHKRKS